MDIFEIALNLQNARLHRRPIPSLDQTLDLNLAKKIFEEGLEIRKQRGEAITGAVLQKDNHFSYLTNQMNLIPGSNFSLKDCISPYFSAHFVYYIDRALSGEKSFENIIEATSSIGIALLVTDSRYEKGKEVSDLEQMADNFFSSYYFLGRKRLFVKDMQNRSVRVAIFLDNQKKVEREISDPIFGLSLFKNFNTLDLGASTILLSPNIFEPIPLGPDMDISVVADYFGATTFKVI